MSTLRAIAVLLILVFESQENILLGKWNETVIECSSKTEFTFKFKSWRSNNSIAIAQCDVALKSCQLMDTVLRNKYNISYTGRAGILYIISRENVTSGTYTCSETYKPDIFASINISSLDVLLSNRSAQDVLGTARPASIECSSKSEITFRYSRRNTNASRSIAECDLTIKTCHILETDTENKYSISYTGRGGILRINNLDDRTIGTYTCCETYNHNHCISTDVNVYYIDDLHNASDGVYFIEDNTIAQSSGEYNKGTNILTVLLPICAGLIVVPIVIIVINRRMQSSNSRNEGNRYPPLSMLHAEEGRTLIDSQQVEDMNIDSSITLPTDAGSSQLTALNISLERDISEGERTFSEGPEEGAPDLTAHTIGVKVTTDTATEQLCPTPMRDKRLTDEMQVEDMNIDSSITLPTDAGSSQFTALNISLKRDISEGERTFSEASEEGAPDLTAHSIGLKVTTDTATEQLCPTPMKDKLLTDQMQVEDMNIDASITLPTDAGLSQLTALNSSMKHDISEGERTFSKASEEGAPDLTAHTIGVKVTTDTATAKLCPTPMEDKPLTDEMVENMHIEPSISLPADTGSQLTGLNASLKHDISDINGTISAPTEAEAAEFTALTIRVYETTEIATENRSPTPIQDIQPTGDMSTTMNGTATYPNGAITGEQRLGTISKTGIIFASGVAGSAATGSAIGLLTFGRTGAIAVAAVGAAAGLTGLSLYASDSEAYKQ